MGARVNLLAGMWLIPLLSVASLATAADPDLRLVNAAAEQDKAAVRALLKQGIDVNIARADGATALLWAAHWNDLDTVDLLLRAGANVNAADDHGVTPLARASVNASAAMVERLLKARANPNAAQTSGLTPLMIAARTGDIEMAKILIAAGVSVNETGSDGTHVLPFSIVAGQADFAMFLIEQGADPNGAMDGVRALHTAAGNADVWLGDWSRRHGDAGGLGGLYARGRGIDPSRRLALVKALLARGADPNARITTSAMLMNYIGYGGFGSEGVQYNSAGNVVAANVRLRWEYQPGSELFVVFNEQRDTLGLGFPALANRAFIIKVNRLFRL